MVEVSKVQFKTGGFGEWQPCDVESEEFALFLSMQDTLESAAGCKFEKFEPIDF